MQQLELTGHVERRVLWPVLAEMTMMEQALADKINCDEWKKDQKGSWISKPGTKIGSYSFRNTTVAPGG
jgi:hypothetical protein